LGLELVELEQDHPPRTKPTPMVEEKRDYKAQDPIKMLLKESLA